jgi:hypothetical protein
MTDAYHDSNKRRAARRRVYKGAQLVTHAMYSTFDCVVRNLSATGALIEVPSTVGIPNTVTLHMNDGSLERSCEVAWRTEVRLGLRFVAEKSARDGTRAHLGNSAAL